MNNANPTVPSRKRKSKIFNTAPIAFQYLSLSFLTKLMMLNITPNKQLTSVTTTKDLGITGKPSFTLIVVGTDLNSNMIKMRVRPENVMDSIEYKFLDEEDFISLLTIKSFV